MNYLLPTFIFLLFILSGKSTFQNPERIIINGETYLLNNYPLQDRLLKDTTVVIPSNSLVDENGITTELRSSACWRGYIGTWEIVNDSLFLKELNTPYSMNDFSFSLEDVFNAKEITPKGIFAYWVNDTLSIFPNRVGVNESQLNFPFINGIIVNR